MQIRETLKEKKGKYWNILTILGLSMAIAVIMTAILKIYKEDIITFSFFNCWIIISLSVFVILSFISKYKKIS